MARDEIPASALADSRRLPPLSVLIVLSAAGPLSLNIFVPSMPVIPAVFGTDYGTVQLTLTLYLLGFAFAQLAYGPLSDRYGRRPLLLAGQWVFFAGTVVCLAADGIWTLIVGRVIQAIGACSGMVLTRAMVRDVHDRDRSAGVLAYVSMAMALAPMVAPSIGGFLDLWLGWRMVFGAVLGVSALSLAASQLTLTETLRPGQVPSGIGDLLASFGYLIRLRSFVGYTAQVSFASGVFFAFVGGAPYVMSEILHRPVSEYGLYFIGIPGMFMVGSFITSRLTPRLGVDRMILLGTGIAVVATWSLVGIVAVDWLSPQTLFGATMLFAIGNGFAMPNGLAAAVSVDPARAGAASGLSGFLQMAAGAGLSFLVGHLLGDSAMPLAVTMAASAGVAFLSHLFANVLGGARS